MTQAAMDNPTDTGALLPVTPEDFEAFDKDAQGVSDAECLAVLLDSYAREAARDRLPSTAKSLHRAARLLRAGEIMRHQSETGAALTREAKGVSAIVDDMKEIRAIWITEGGCFSDAITYVEEWASRLAALAQPVEAGEDGLLTAAVALQKDLLDRAEWDDDCKVVCVGSGAWRRFCDAIDAVLGTRP